MFTILHIYDGYLNYSYKTPSDQFIILKLIIFLL